MADLWAMWFLLVSMMLGGRLKKSMGMIFVLNLLVFPNPSDLGGVGVVSQNILKEIGLTSR
jgi:hypothetical protein